jgi:hypothetical protein
MANIGGRRDELNYILSDVDEEVLMKDIFASSCNDTCKGKDESVTNGLMRQSLQNHIIASFVTGISKIPWRHLARIIVAISVYLGKMSNGKFALQLLYLEEDKNNLPPINIHQEAENTGPLKCIPMVNRTEIFTKTPSPVTLLGVEDDGPGHKIYPYFVSARMRDGVVDFQIRSAKKGVKRVSVGISMGDDLENISLDAMSANYSNGKLTSTDKIGTLAMDMR